VAKKNNQRHIKVRGEYQDAVRLVTFIETQPETGIDFANLHLVPIVAKLKEAVDPSDYQVWMRQTHDFDLDAIMSQITHALISDDDNPPVGL